jgi:hypothetical protein
MFKCKSQAWFKTLSDTIQCKHRHKSCVYVQSRRGGARIRKKAAPKEEKITSNHDLNHCPLSVLPELDTGIARTFLTF